MFIDMLGKARVKLCLHIHSAFGGGELTPPEIAELYAAEGYDAIAITDKWIYSDECEMAGLLVLSGIEYDVGKGDRESGIYHVVGVGMTSDPDVPYDWRNMKKTAPQKAAQIVEKIRLYNGFSFIGSPSWCENTGRKLLDVVGFDALEIFNGSAMLGAEDKTYAGDVVRELETLGAMPLLVAADGAEECAEELFSGAVMVEATEMDSQSIVRALKAGRFYATEGPEVHISATVGGKVKVLCSPCSKIQLFTGLDELDGKIFEGEGLIEAEYTVREGDRFIRAEVADELGNRAWTNYITLD